jgi:isohexenylglutaconyl-CoA hydratase
MPEALPTLTTRFERGVLHLTLNRPEVRNAMSLAMVDELLTALNSAETDGVTRVIVLRGAGGHFCAGADLKDMAAARAKASDDSDPVAHTNTRFGWLCAEFARTPLAVVAVVEGTVMGGGFGLACAADVTLAHASASFRPTWWNASALPKPNAWRSPAANSMREPPSPCAWYMPWPTTKRH